ncbi:MAG: TatD family hydrolase [Candidatus Euphemobacter frigidus]|nr:TatD family hydrolase [Candidatus Euphemobacter frigidus]MDP8275539.1 TatD family hydrolase [Candidatus Euphemobacter frigidus]
MKLIDCHAHLDEFDEVGTVLKRAVEARVTEILGVGVNTATSRRILEIARGYRNPRIMPAVGLYPDEVTEEEIGSILSLIDEEHRNLAALGEIGLDYWIKPLRKKQPGRENVKALQQEAFRLQLKKARRYSLVPIVHSRGAWADSFRLVEEEGLERAVFHWYTGPLEVLKKILAAGYYVSATPAAAYSPQLREVLSRAPLERIILETDCPVPRRVGDERIGTEPADVRYSLKALAALKEIPEEEVARITTMTAGELFIKPGF